MRWRQSSTACDASSKTVRPSSVIRCCGDEYMSLIEEVATKSKKFYAIDMTHFEEDVEKTLLGLGFERSDFGRQTSEFSGGWRMRIELAKMLLLNPDVLLLNILRRDAYRGTR